MDQTLVIVNIGGIGLLRLEDIHFHELKKCDLTKNE